MSIGLSSVLFGDPVLPVKIEERRDAVLSVSPSGHAQQPKAARFVYALHPYLGYVLEPGSVYGRYGVKINDYGFPGDEDPLGFAADDFVVGITGGSVAVHFFVEGRDRLRPVLARYPAAAGKTVRFVCLAHIGYKQPQQLNSVTYYLALGGKLDVLLNLDGFNEINDFVPGIYPAYPQHWQLLTSELLSPAQLQRTGGVALLSEARLMAARIFWSLRYSATANLIWFLGDRVLEASIMTSWARLRDVRSERLPFGRRGPDKAPKDPYAFGARIWARSSLMLHQLMRARGAAYFHFLQPNQYVPNSKTYSAEESRRVNGDAATARNVAAGYPMLREYAAELRAGGVAYVDLAQIFSTVTETIYTDPCCHVNQRGNEILADAIGRHLGAVLAAPRDG